MSEKYMPLPKQKQTRRKATREKGTTVINIHIKVEKIDISGLTVISSDKVTATTITGNRADADVTDAFERLKAEILDLEDLQEITKRVLQVATSP